MEFEFDPAKSTANQERIRIISVRRSRDEEVVIYEG
jgi:uncharacterized DUF497 family protein